MAVKVKPTEVREGRAPLRLIVGQRRRRTFDLHLVSYVVGNAVFWILWAAISVPADSWSWWPVVPFVAWTIVLLVHALLVRRNPQ